MSGGDSEEEATMGPNVMKPNDEGRRETRLALAPGSEAMEETHVVFDFSETQGVGLSDLALVLTARLQAGPAGTVWVRRIPYETWQILRALGLDHLFHVYPGPGEELN